MSQHASHGPNTSSAASPRHEDQFQRELIAMASHLRAFSRVLCGRRDAAEDLAQEALMKAWRARDNFVAGTNLKAWLFTILRNGFYSHGRRAWREAHLDAEAAERIEAPANEQEWFMELSDTARAMRALPDAQREAIILVGAGGFSYEEAAEICDSAVGTMKSRVARGRAALLSALDGHEPMSQRPSKHRLDAAEAILAQMTALSSVGTRRSAHA